jgi:hypothetical protein
MAINLTTPHGIIVNFLARKFKQLGCAGKRNFKVRE